jgi:hypothetical protein
MGIPLGYKRSPESRERSRLARLGKKHTPEALAKMRGIKLSPDRIAKMREMRLVKARAHGLINGAENDYALARSRHFSMKESIGIANRSLLCFRIPCLHRSPHEQQS